MILRCFVAFYPKIILICVDLNFWSHIWCYIFPSNICVPKKTSLIDVELKSDFTDLQNIKHFTQIQFHYKLIFPPDGQISPGEFKNFKKKQLGHQLSEEDHEHLDLEFRLADRDGNGIIDWWEFLNYQTKVKLAMRDQVGRNTEYLPTIHLIVIKME